MSRTLSVICEGPESEDVVQASLRAFAQTLLHHGVVVEPAWLREADRAVRDLWGGNVTYVAKGRLAARQQLAIRDGHIVRAFRAGASISSLAAEHGVSHRRIHQILAAAKDAEINPMGDFRHQKYHLYQSQANHRLRRPDLVSFDAESTAAALPEPRSWP